MPSSESSIVRIRYAPQMATAKTTTCSSVGSSVGLKTRESTSASGQPQDDDHHLPAGEVGHVAVDGMDGAQQLAGELPALDAPLPAVGREDDVHVADQRPDDIVGGKFAGGVAVHGAALRRWPSSTRPPGR